MLLLGKALITKLITFSFFFLLSFFIVLSKVISPLPLGERVRVRGKKDFSDALQNTF
jgi:hypothetical protein